MWAPHRHSIAFFDCRRIRLLVCATGVIHVVTAQSVAPRRTIMTTFTIDNDNNITAFGSAEEAAAATTTPFDTFASQKELAELAAAWPAERLVAIWNSLPGVTPVKRFKSAKAAASRIWERIQGLGEAAKPEAEPAKPKADKKAKGGAQAAKGAPTKGKAPKKTSPAKKPAKAPKAASRRPRVRAKVARWPMPSWRAASRRAWPASTSLSAPTRSRRPRGSTDRN
jgi:hypothetical protein